MPFSDGLQSERPSEKQNAAPKQPAFQQPMQIPFYNTARH